MKKLALIMSMIILMLTCFSSCSTSKYEVVMEYNGIEITEDMYYYWLTTFKRNILTSYTDAFDTPDFWGGKYDEDTTVEEYFTEVINSRIMNYLIAQDLFKQNRLKLSSDVKKAIDDDIKEKVEYYGGKKALNKELEALKLNVSSLEKVYTWEEKHEAVYNYFFGKNGVEEISDADLTEYYEENYSRIFYIVFYTTKIMKDDKGNVLYEENGDIKTEEMTPDELAKKQEKIDECMSRLNAGANFEAMRKEYTEYDNSKYTNGFFVSANEVSIWGEDIVLAVKDAKPGDVFKVEEESAVYIVFKSDLTDLNRLSDLDLEQLANLTSYATTSKYDAKFSELYQSVKVNYELLNKYKLSAVKANPFYSF